MFTHQASRITFFISIALLATTIGCHQKNEPSSTASIANDGLPHTLAELDAWYPEPSGQNAATIWLKGFDTMQVEGFPNAPLVGKAKLPPLGSPLPQPMKSSAAAVTQANAQALRFF